MLKLLFIKKYKYIGLQPADSVWADVRADVWDKLNNEWFTFLGVEISNGSYFNVLNHQNIFSMTGKSLKLGWVP